MKWYKHISDSLDDPFIFDLVDRFGGDGYLVFFGTLEIMSREFNVGSPGTCTISRRFLTKKLQLSSQKVMKVLDFCNKKGRIMTSLNGNNITLNCPKLKDMCDDWTNRLLRSYSEVTPKKPRLEEEEEEDNKDSDISPICPHQKIVNAYHEILPELTRIKEWNETRRKLLKKRWSDDIKRQNLKWWEGYFEYVRKSPFLMGDKTDFHADLEWLIKPSNFTKVIEGRYHK